MVHGGEQLDEIERVVLLQEGLEFGGVMGGLVLGVEQANRDSD